MENVLFNNELNQFNYHYKVLDTCLRTAHIMIGNLLQQISFQLAAKNVLYASSNRYMSDAIQP